VSGPGKRAVWGAVLAGLTAGCAGAPLPASAPASPAARPPTGLRRFVPGPVLSLLSVDLARLRRSAWALPVIDSAAPAGERSSRGFDEIADVDQWLFARVRAPGAGAGTLELGRGRFDHQRVLEAFRDHHPDARPQRFADVGGVADPEGGLAFLDEGVIALGPAWAIESAVRASGSAPATEPWLIEAAEAVERAGGAETGAAVELWVRADEATRAELAGVLDGADAIDWLAARLQLHDDARAVAVAATRRESDAMGVAAQLRDQLIALLDRRSVRALGLSPVLARARVRTDGPRVLLDLGISGSEREVVAQRLAVLAEILARARKNAKDARTEPGP
jgi:hypothetical protein